MRVAEALDRVGGVADTATLIRLTSRRKVRTAVRNGDIVRDARGRMSLLTAKDAVRAANRLCGVVSHQGAAAYWGWELKTQPDRPVVTVPRNRKVSAERRDEVTLRWGLLDPDDVWQGIVTKPGRTVIDCAKGLPFDEALTIGDSALRHGNVTKSRLLQLAEDVAGPGRSACRRVAREANGRAANPFESVARAISLDVPGLHLVPQVVIREQGFTVRPDLVDEARRLVVEADSFAFHGSRRALVSDCERYNLLNLAGWTVLRFSWEHVMLTPEFVAACLRCACTGGCPVDAARLRRTA